jgi:hypothetical protein
MESKNGEVMPLPGTKEMSTEQAKKLAVQLMDISRRGDYYPLIQTVLTKLHERMPDSVDKSKDRDLISEELAEVIVGGDSQLSGDVNIKYTREDMATAQILGSETAGLLSYVVSGNEKVRNAMTDPRLLGDTSRVMKNMSGEEQINVLMAVEVFKKAAWKLGNAKK